MMLYIDTNIIIDAAEGRKNRNGKDVGSPAADLLWQAASCKYRLIISDWMLEELDGFGRLSSAKMLFGIIKKKTKLVSYSREEKERAKRISSDSGDALHILIAEREHATCIVTRDVDDFVKIGSMIPIERPENLL